MKSCTRCDNMVLRSPNGSFYAICSFQCDVFEILAQLIIHSQYDEPDAKFSEEIYTVGECFYRLRCPHARECEWLEVDVMTPTRNLPI